MASIIAQPFEHIAEALGKSFRALFREVPLQWQPFVFIAVIFLIVVIIFTISGLQIRLPFVTIATTTAPALPGNIHGNLQQLQDQLQNVVRHLNDVPAQPRGAIDNAPLQEDIHNRLGQVYDVLNAINERQQAKSPAYDSTSSSASTRGPWSCGGWCYCGWGTGRET